MKNRLSHNKKKRKKYYDGPRIVMEHVVGGFFYSTIESLNLTTSYWSAFPYVRLFNILHC